MGFWWGEHPIDLLRLYKSTILSVTLLVRYSTDSMVAEFILDRLEFKNKVKQIIFTLNAAENRYIVNVDLCQINVVGSCRNVEQ